MAGIRSAPKAPPKPKAKVKAPIHQRILGRAQVEIDTLADLEIELEQAYSLDHIEYDTYLECWEALEIRKAKAREGLDKATGRYVKPDKKVDIRVRNVRRYPPSLFKKKLVCIVIFLIIFKIFC